MRSLEHKQRGRLTSLQQRKQYITWIQEAKHSGARITLTCNEVGISLRTYRRWYKQEQTRHDKRAVRPLPSNKLIDNETATIIAVCNESRFAM